MTPSQDRPATATGIGWNSLFYPNARLIPCARAAQKNAEPVITARVVDGRGVHQESRANLQGQRVLRARDRAAGRAFGSVAHVFSTYESRHAANDPQPFTRGINSIQLFFDGTRWWAMTIFWDSERPGQAIPEEYKPKK